MNEDIALRHIPRTFFLINLNGLSRNLYGFTIEQLIAALEATTQTDLHVDFSSYKPPTPENNRRFIEPLCRCIANLRLHNPNHPLRTLEIRNVRGRSHHVDQFLAAAKQFGIHHLGLCQANLRILSLEELCCGNSNLKVLDMSYTNLFDQDSTISVPPLQGFSAILALDKLAVRSVTLESSNVVTKFLNIIAHATYPALELGEIGIPAFDDDDDDSLEDYSEKKIARMRLVANLIKPSVQQLTLEYCCPIEVMDAIEACATVTQIQSDRPVDFPRAAQQKLQAIATRNRELARFVANPHDYPADELLKLMTQFDKSPTGLYMLVRCLPGIPSFFKSNEITDASTAGAKKRKLM